MQIINSTDNVKLNNTAVALGSFDALHKAHMRLVEAAQEYGKKHNLLSGVYMFDVRPETVLNADNTSKNILSNADKCKILQEVGIDFVWFEKFDNDFSHTSARDFAVMLKEKLGVKLVVAGFHYHFGYRGEGDANMLIRLGEELGFEVKIIEPVSIGNVLVSSTHIRGLLGKADFDEAGKFMGRRFFVSGRVQSDRGVGTQMGIPTANIVPDNNNIVLPYGVYATACEVADRRYPSVTNIGVRPTFGLSTPVIETHILDFDKDIYGKEIKVEFLQKIRDEKKFLNKEELSKQISDDIKKANAIFTSEFKM